MQEVRHDVAARRADVSRATGCDNESRSAASAGTVFSPLPMPIATPSAKPDALIEIDHVTFGYDATRTIIDDITLDFPRGKVTSTGVMWQTIIHTIFILSALGIAWTDKVMTGSSSKREQHAH